MKLTGCKLRRHWSIEALPGFSIGQRAVNDNAWNVWPSVVLARSSRPQQTNELVSLIARAALAIGVDTGLAHLAAALKVPTIALYISTDPAFTGVYGSGFFQNLGNTGNPGPQRKSWR